MKQKLGWFLAVLLCTVLLFTTTHSPKRKFLVILQAGRETHEGTARAVHALLYTKELKGHGHEVVLVFDGAGTEWVAEWTKPGSTDKLLPKYEGLKRLGITEVICDFCAAAFEVKEVLEKGKVPLTAEYEGHPSIAKWVDQGYQVIVL